MTQEQNTEKKELINWSYRNQQMSDTLYKHLGDHYFKIGKLHSSITDAMIEHADEHHASKLKELSKKGEPTEEEIKAWAEKNFSSPLAIVSACGAADWMRDRLSPVIALLHHDIAWAKAEKKQKDEEIAALRAENEELKKHISTCESDHVNIDELMSEFDRRGINTFDWDGDEGAESAIVDGVERYVETKDEEIASLRAQLEEVRKALSFYADQSKYQTPLYDNNDLNNLGMPFPDKGHIAREMLEKISKGGKAHE